MRPFPLWRYKIKPRALRDKTTRLQLSTSRGESGAHSVTFSKIGFSAYTFNSWCFILSWYIPYIKSFKCPIGVLVASQLVLTLESVMCRVIWQNLPHLRSRFCHLQGHILSVMGNIFLVFITARHLVSLECIISICSINPRQLQYIKNDHQVWFWHRIFSRLV